MNANGWNGTKVEKGSRVKVWASELGGRGVEAVVRGVNPNTERAEIEITKTRKGSAYQVGNVVSGVGIWWLESI
jgi:hypothetical protein